MISKEKLWQHLLSYQHSDTHPLELPGKQKYNKYAESGNNKSKYANHLWLRQISGVWFGGGSPHGVNTSNSACKATLLEVQYRSKVGRFFSWESGRLGEEIEIRCWNILGIYNDTHAFIVREKADCGSPENIHTPPLEGIGIFLGGGGSVRLKNLVMKFNEISRGVRGCKKYFP